MKKSFPEEVEKGRRARSTDPYDGESSNSGYFIIRYKGYFLNIIASDGGGWDHVSVSVRKQKREPTWEEMCYVKDLFFEPEEVALQYHPSKSEYVNIHSYVLHLWRPQRLGIPMPPKVMV